MIGIDILEIERIEKSIKSENFTKKVFTEKEYQHYIDKGSHTQTLAGIFCAKEAVSKALQTGIRKFNFLDIEICYTDLGAPYAILKNHAQTLLNNRQINISISHNNSTAVAVAVII